MHRYIHNTCWTASGIQKFFQWNKTQQFFPKRDTVQWGVRIYLSRAYFTVEMLTSFTSLKAVLLSFPIQTEEDRFPTMLHPAFLLSEPLLTSPHNKLDYSFPLSLRDMVLILFDLCEHSIGLFHSSSWPMQTRFENRYCHFTVLLLRKKKLRLLVQQGSKLRLWCGPLRRLWAQLTLSSRPASPRLEHYCIYTGGLSMIKSSLQWERVLVRYQNWADWHTPVP